MHLDSTVAGSSRSGDHKRDRSPGGEQTVMQPKKQLQATGVTTAIDSMAVSEAAPPSAAAHANPQRTLRTNPSPHVRTRRE